MSGAIESLSLNDRKERFSLAYIEAVAAQAGFMVERAGLDRDSRDGTIVARGSRRPKLDFQAKAHAAVPPDDPAATIPFDLPMNNYDDLRSLDALVPALLFVVLVPSDPSTWFEVGQQEARLRHIGFWASLRGLDAKPNASTRRIWIPATQRLDAATLVEIMELVAKGAPP